MINGWRRTPRPQPQWEADARQGTIYVDRAPRKSTGAKSSSTPGGSHEEAGITIDSRLLAPPQRSARHRGAAEQVTACCPAADSGRPAATEATEDRSAGPLGSGCYIPRFATCPRISPPGCAAVCTLTYALPLLNSAFSESPDTVALAGLVRSMVPVAIVPDAAAVTLNP
jgi:hypothetical protein